jgi:hypothetical protein
MERALNLLNRKTLRPVATQRRGRAALALAVLCAALGGCATPTPPAPPAPAPAQPALADLLQDAQTAQQAGAKEKARQALREAARHYPTSKDPWVRLASEYFDSLDYGNAILAAQEVTQRDPQDATAHSILAVSGLRVSSAALSALRAQQAGMPNDTRAEAQNLTRVLRETLGEQVLVPRAEPPAPVPVARRPRSPVKPPEGAVAATAAAPTTAAAPQAGSTPPRVVAAVPASPTPAVGASPALPLTPAAGPTPTAAKPASPAAAKPPAPAKPAANPFDILR